MLGGRPGGRHLALVDQGRLGVQNQQMLGTTAEQWAMPYTQCLLRHLLRRASRSFTRIPPAHRASILDRPSETLILGSSRSNRYIMIFGTITA